MGLIGYKCLLCGDIVYQRTSWDKDPQCRCGNVHIDSNAMFQCTIPKKYEKVYVSFGDGIDKNILERDESYGYEEYGVIYSNLDEDDLDKYRAEVMLVKNNS